MVPYAYHLWDNYRDSPFLKSCWTYHLYMACPPYHYLSFFKVLFLYYIYMYIFWGGMLGLCSCTWGISLVAASGGYCLLPCTGFSLRWLLCASVVAMHVLSCPAASGIFPDQWSNLCPLHWSVCGHSPSVVSNSFVTCHAPLSKNTGVGCLGRQILNHWTTKEILSVSFFISLSFIFYFVLPVSGYFQPQFHWERSPL